MSNSRFASEFAKSVLPTLHYWHAFDLVYKTRGGTDQPIRGLLGGISTRVQDTDGNRRITESRPLHLNVDPSSTEYSGIEDAIETAAIGEKDPTSGTVTRWWTIESRDRPHDGVLTLRLVRSLRTDLTTTDRYRT